jgi:hypothetical protein
MDIYIHSPIRFHGEVLDLLSIETFFFIFILYFISNFIGNFFLLQTLKRAVLKVGVPIHVVGLPQGCGYAE